jgi:cytochrome P450
MSLRSSAIAPSEIDDATLRSAVVEILELIRTLVAGGSESTASLLGSTLYLLLTHPDQFAQVRADHRLIPQMIEEVLRFQPPVQWNLRTVMTEGVSVGEVAILPRSRVMLGWGAANRDPERFGHETDRFDILRKGPQHAAFGHAYHFCLGAPLARLEARIACEQLFLLLSNIELAVPAEQLSFVALDIVRRLESLPLRFTAAGTS